MYLLLFKFPDLPAIYSQNEITIVKPQGAAHQERMAGPIPLCAAHLPETAPLSPHRRQSPETRERDGEWVAKGGIPASPDL